jgi:hypothetical protein
LKQWLDKTKTQVARVLFRARNSIIVIYVLYVIFSSHSLNSSKTKLNHSN